MATIRPATAADIASVIALTERWATEPSTTGNYVYNSPEQLERHLGSFFWVAEEAGMVVGFLLGSRNGDGERPMHYQLMERGEEHVSLDQIYIHPDFRNRGIGRQLVARFRAEADAAGISCCLLLSQNVDWERTRRFYERCGFRPWYFTMFTGQSMEERRPSRK